MISRRPCTAMCLALLHDRLAASRHLFASPITRYNTANPQPEAAPLPSLGDITRD